MSQTVLESLNPTHPAISEVDQSDRCLSAYIKEDNFHEVDFFLDFHCQKRELRRLELDWSKNGVGVKVGSAQQF